MINTVDYTLPHNTIKDLKSLESIDEIINNLTRAFTIQRIDKQSLEDGIEASRRVLLGLKWLGLYVWDIPKYSYLETNLNIDFDDYIQHLMEANWKMFSDMREIISQLSLRNVDFDLLIEHFEWELYDTRVPSYVWEDAYIQAESFIRELKATQNMLFCVQVSNKVGQIITSPTQLDLLPIVPLPRSKLKQKLAQNISFYSPYSNIHAFQYDLFDSETSQVA